MISGGAALDALDAMELAGLVQVAVARRPIGGSGWWVPEQRLVVLTPDCDPTRIPTLADWVWTQLPLVAGRSADL